MTRQQAKDLLPIITAYANGETIQCHAFSNESDPWTDVDRPAWDKHMEYRIKPKPREWDVIFWKNGEAQIVPRNYCTSNVSHIRERLHVREVLVDTEE